MSSSASVTANISRATSSGPLSQKRPLSDSEATDEVDTKRVKKTTTQQENPEHSKERDNKDKKKRRKKKRKTSIVVVDTIAGKGPINNTPQRPSSIAPPSSSQPGRASSSTLSTITLNSTVESPRHTKAGPSTSRPEGDQTEDDAPTLSVCPKQYLFKMS